MKVTALATAMVLAAGTAFAGNVAPMVMDAPEMVMEPASSGSGAMTWLVPLIAIAAIALAADD